MGGHKYMRSRNFFLESMTFYDFEFFAMDFLCELEGFCVLLGPSYGQDRGRDLLVIRANKKYVVTCKHSSAENKVIGIGEDYDFSDRIKANQADGIICFYYAMLSTALQSKIHDLQTAGYEIIVFDRNDIISKFEKMDFFTLNKYCYPYNFNNIPSTLYNHLPLNCMICKQDILLPQSIPSSGGFLLLIDNRLTFIYGCKHCINNYCRSYYIYDNLPYIELWQALFPAHLNAFQDIIGDYTSLYNLDDNFYKNLSYFSIRCSQVFMPESSNPLPLSNIF